jgi:hypothetical protein
MKRRRPIFWIIRGLMAAVLVASCATTPSYEAKEYEEIYGTWINKSYSDTMQQGYDQAYTLANYAQKIITTDEGTYDIYNGLNDIVPIFKIKYTITEKWTDSDGNIWYKIVSEYETEYAERTRLGLNKIDHTGSTWEIVIAEDDYPAKLDPSHPEYRIYYRSEE